MDVIEFPGLGIHLTISKIACYILGFPVYSYAVCIVSGIIIALILCKLDEKNHTISFDFVLEVISFAIVFGIIGARIYYVIFHFSYYTNIWQIIRLRDGGLAIYGGFLAGGYVILKKCKAKGVNPITFLDYIAPFVALAQSIGRWGNFFNREAYGYETQSIIRMGIQTANGYQEVHPVFLYESIATFIIFLLLRIMQKRTKFEGQIFYVYLLFYTGVRMFLESFRVDSLLFFHLRISQVLSIVVFLWSTIMIVKNVKICMKKENMLEKL